MASSSSAPLLNPKPNGISVPDAVDDLIAKLVTFTISRKRIRHEAAPSQAGLRNALLQCQRGNVLEARTHLNSTTNTDGDTALIVAAREESPQTVLLLLQYGAKIDARNRHGRSALVEAARYGRADNVALLLEHGAADRQKDNMGLCAFDYAGENVLNLLEAEMLYFEHHGRSETFEPWKRPWLETFQVLMLAIFGSLSECIVEQVQFTAEGSKHAPSGLKFRLRAWPGPDVMEFEWSMQFPPYEEMKTVASLDRGGGLPRVFALSGYGDYAPMTFVTQSYWTSCVFIVAEIMSFKLPPTSMDGGKDGQWYACHADKQAIAYFICEHVLEHPGLLYLLRKRREKGHLKGAPWISKDLLPYRPQMILRKTHVSVTRNVCENCRSFEGEVNSFFGLDVTLEYHEKIPV